METREVGFFKAVAEGEESRHPIIIFCLSYEFDKKHVARP